MATKKVSYITLLKEAMKNVQEFDSSQLDIVMPQVKQVLDYDGKAEIKTTEKTDASSILERYYFREENEEEKDEDEDKDEEEKVEECDVKREEIEDDKKEDEKKEDEEGEEKEVLEAYKLFKEQEEAGTKKDMPVAKEPADEVGKEEIEPEGEAGTTDGVAQIKEQDEEKDEDEDEVPEAEIEEQDEMTEEEPEEEPEEDVEKAVVEKLIAELEEEPEEDKEEDKKEDEEGEKKEVKEGIVGTVGGAALGGAVGGPLGAVAGGAAGHITQKKLAQEQDEIKGKEGEEEKDEEEKDEEPLDVDKKLKEALPALPRTMANKNTEMEEAKLIKEAQEAIKYFLEEEDEEEKVSSKDVVV